MEFHRDAFALAMAPIDLDIAVVTGRYDVLYGHATIDYRASSVRFSHDTSHTIELYRQPRPAPTPCRNCGATRLEERVTGWRCAYCGSDR